MKKSLLAMIILSTAAFGANPGQDTPTESTHKGEVGVPMEVRVTVLPQGPQLVLLDENDVLINKLVFDHGSMVAGLSQKSTLEKEVRLARADGKPFGENTRTYKAKFEAKDLNGNAIAGDGSKNLTLNGHGAASGKTVDSTLNYRTDDITVSTTDKMVMTKVTSTIDAIPSSQTSGLYVGSGTFNATLTMD